MWRSAALVGLALLGVVASSAADADSKSQVTAMGNLTVRNGPGWNHKDIGRLQSGAKYYLRDCTREHGWCLVVGNQKQTIGWVRADDLRGFKAKIEVTPWEPLFNPFEISGGRHHEDKSEP